MGTTIFKRLAEVQILHDYFLTTANGTSFFELNKEKKQSLLDKKINRGLYSGNQIFEIAPQDETILSENNILFVHTPMGFLLGVEVYQIFDSGETRYKPICDIPKKVTLPFILKPKLPYFMSLTNVNLNPPYPANYYFTNKGKQEFVESSVPPHNSLPLSKNAASPQPTESYEMGTLLDFGAKIKEAIQVTSSSNLANWEDVKDRKFVTIADKMLLPHDFQYSFGKNQLVTQVEAILEDSGNNEVKKIKKTSIQPMESITLNFIKVDDTDETSDEISSGVYNLRIKMNGATELVYQIYLSKDRYDHSNFGIVELRFDEENSPFSLVDTQGYLKTKIDGAAQKISHPVFEIRLENRRSYWRYNKESKFTNDEINATSSFLDTSGTNRLIAKKPKGLTASLVPFKNGSELLLPNPKVPNIRVEQNKIYSEIYINQSNGLLKT